MSDYGENYKRYKEYYLSKLREKYTEDELRDKLKEKIDFYSSMPIMHSTQIGRLEKILEEGIQCFNARGGNFDGSAVYDSEIQSSFSNYVFANVGRIPSYYSKDERVGLMLSDEVDLNDESFFSFHDIALIRNFNWNDLWDVHRATKIISQEPQERMPLSKMRNILALNSVLTETNNENGVTKPFPNAIDSDFKNKNGGIPEIKIWDFVNPNFIIGFVIENPELLNELVNKGISKDKVLVIDPQRDILEQLIEFKKRVLEQEKNHDGQGDNESR